MAKDNTPALVQIMSALVRELMLSKTPQEQDRCFALAFHQVQDLEFSKKLYPAPDGGAEVE
jgi:hypothetical protein